MAAALPPSAPESLYRFVGRVPILRRFVNVLVRSVIPETIRIQDGIIALNRNDPVISGALAFNAYEKREAQLFRSRVKEGMTVIDIGANLGFYTVIAANRVGRHGTVLAFEPAPENYALLQETVRLNGFRNTTCWSCAISNTTGQTDLFLSRENMGDHTIHDPGGARETVKVEVVSLDAVLEVQAISLVDIIKMDIQGAEGLALEGMKSTLAANPAVELFVEWYPFGLRRVGTDPLTFLGTLEAHGFSLWRVGDVLEPVRDFQKLVDNTTGKKYSTLYARRIGS